MKISLASIYDWYRKAIRHPQYRWWIVLGTLAYLISPFDLSPDIFPIAGQVDDVILATLLITELSQMMIDKYKARKQPQDAAQPDNVTVEVEAEKV
ncbi:MAG TPA: YkvA family protein [Xenococcaceae cyanobacterium]